MKHLDIVLYNAVILICFTVITISFGKWWIVLFAALFLAGEKQKKDE